MSETIIIDNATMQFLARRADELIDERNENDIHLFICSLERVDFSFDHYLTNASFHYTLGNCYSHLNIITNSNWYSDEVSKGILHYRKAMHLLESNDAQDENNKKLRSLVETNLANNLVSQGRILCGRKHWDKAISIDNNPVAIIRKALNELKIANCLYDDSHRYHHYYHAHKLINSGLAQIDELHSSQRSAYHDDGELMRFYRWFEESFTEEDFQLDKSYVEKVKTKINRAYLEWSAEKRLFINDLNDIYTFDLVFQDIFSLPDMSFKINDILTLNEELIFHGLYDEIKNDFCYARYLTFISESIPDDKNHFFNSTYSHIEDFSYSLTNIKGQHLKSAFKTLFSIFDKIAYFLNAYLGLRDVGSKIYFQNVFGDISNGLLKPNEKIKGSDNIFVHALFYILKDFRDTNPKGLIDDKLSYWLDPDMKAFSDIRNAIEHKSFGISDDFGFTLYQSDEPYKNKKHEAIKKEISELKEKISITSKLIKDKAHNDRSTSLENLLIEKDTLIKALDDLTMKSKDKEQRSKFSLHISEEDFMIRLYDMFELVRNSIIYLSMCVHHEENKRKSSGGLSIPRELPLKRR